MMKKFTRIPRIKMSREKKKMKQRGRGAGRSKKISRLNTLENISKTLKDSLGVVVVQDILHLLL